MRPHLDYVAELDDVGLGTLIELVRMGEPLDLVDLQRLQACTGILIQLVSDRLGGHPELDDLATRLAETRLVG